MSDTIQDNKALIAMSGGVDSSVAAYLMQRAGYDCTGCTMQLYNHEDEGEYIEKTCCSLHDIDDARRVCGRLSIPHSVVNYRDVFRERVIDRFVAFYERGMTPNPCVDCNKYIKFDELFHRADELSCRYIVTGHYARIVEEDGVFYLKKASDRTKDQSYFLYDVTQDKLRRMQFPLGEYHKSEIRKIAEEQGFLNAQKHDSQDICFVPDGDYAAVIRERTGRDYPAGNFVDRSGHILGQHKGIIHYTVGQRRGLGIAAPEPYYVQEIRPEDNTVVLGSDAELFQTTLFVSDMNWIAGAPREREISCLAKIRYRHPEQEAKVTLLSENEIRIEFKEPQRAITKGQSAVLYDGDTVLGGGIITQVP